MPDFIDESTDESEQLLQKYIDWLQLYTKYLSQTVTVPTVRKQGLVINAWLEFVYLYHSVKSFNELSVAMCSSHFIRYFNSHYDERLQRITIQTIIKKFLRYTHHQQPITNKRLLNWIK